MGANRPDIHGAPRCLTTEEASAVYEILVNEAGARPGEDEHRDFVRYASKDRFVEWRFMGKLGFGGKLYFDGWGIPRVGCYREDDTPARSAVIAATNEKLLSLFAPSPTSES